MKFLRVEASFSIIDEQGEHEHQNLGPYMNMPTVIDALNMTLVSDPYGWKKQVNERKVVKDSFYSLSDRHPMPDDQQRELFMVSCSCVCGFMTMEELRNWFCNRDLLILHTTGFFIVEYELKSEHSVLEDNLYSWNENQTVFDMSKCEMKGFIDIRDLLNA